MYDWEAYDNKAFKGASEYFGKVQKKFGIDMDKWELDKSTFNRGYNGNGVKFALKRKDGPDKGFVVFIDEKDPDWLNIARLTLTAPQVILAVGLFRGMQIANTYQREHSTGNYNYLDMISLSKFIEKDKISEVK